MLDGETPHEVFDVIEIAGRVIQVRSAFLFEIGEELTVQIEQDGTMSDATARVRAHLGPPDAPITELEISVRSGPRHPTNR